MPPAISLNGFGDLERASPIKLRNHSRTSAILCVSFRVLVLEHAPCSGMLRAAGRSSRDLATIQSHMADGSNTSALLLVQALASFSRSELRWELARIAAAVALLSIALAAIALFCFRRGTRDLTLIYFGLFCILYAVRLLALLSSFRSLFNESQMFWY